MTSRVIFSIIMFFVISTVSAQDNPKDIYQLFQLTKGGCPLEKALPKRLLAEEVPDDFPVGFEEKKEDTISKEELKALFTDFKKAVKNIAPDHSNQTKKLYNGNLCFLKKDKWGIRDPSGQVILNPQFDYVLPDTTAGGFSGYIDGQCKYYNASGQPVIDESFYHISPLDHASFIVRGVNGFGLWKDGELLIEAENKSIRRGISNGEYYYKIHSTKKGAYLLLSDLKTELPFPALYEPHLAGNDYLVYWDNILDLKNKRALICEGGFELAMLDPEYQLATIKKERERELYLIDFRGNLLVPHPLQYISSFNDAGLAIATIKDPERIHGQLFGLIDRQGNWVINPVYERIQGLGDYLVIQNADRKSGVYTQAGKEILPAKYDFITQINGNVFMTHQNSPADLGATKKVQVLDMATQKVIAKDLPYKLLRYTRVCGQTRYVASLMTKGEIILDENFEAITPMHQRFFINEETLVGANVNNQQRRREKMLYDCDGNIQTFKVNNMVIDTISEFRRINDKLMYITLLDNNNYLIREDGEPVPMNPYINNFANANLGDLLIVNSFIARGQGMADSNGHLILPYKFSYLSPFEPETGMAIFRTKGGQTGLINYRGELFLDNFYKSIRYLGFGFYAVETPDKKHGLINQSGEWILPLEYNYIGYSQGFITATRGRNTEYYDIMGRKIPGS